MTSSDSFVSLPEGAHVLLHLKEDDGSLSTIELDQYVPHLLSVGRSALARKIPSPPEETDALGYFEVPDEATFTVDGELVDAADALSYLASGVEDALRSALGSEPR